MRLRAAACSESGQVGERGIALIVCGCVEGGWLVGCGAVCGLVSFGRRSSLLYRQVAYIV